MNKVTDAILDAFCARLTEFVNKDAVPVNYQKMVYDKGSKYIRIVSEGPGYGGRSSFGFLDYEGNIYKSDGWKRPAKHIRGNIFNDAIWTDGTITRYGIKYLYR